MSLPVPGGPGREFEEGVGRLLRAPGAALPWAAHSWDDSPCVTLRTRQPRGAELGASISSALGAVGGIPEPVPAVEAASPTHRGGPAASLLPCGAGGKGGRAVLWDTGWSRNVQCRVGSQGLPAGGTEKEFLQLLGSGSQEALVVWGSGARPGSCFLCFLLALLASVPPCFQPHPCVPTAHAQQRDCSPSIHRTGSGKAAWPPLPRHGLAWVCIPGSCGGRGRRCAVTEGPQRP